MKKHFLLLFIGTFLPALASSKLKAVLCAVALCADPAGACQSIVVHNYPLNQGIFNGLNISDASASRISMCFNGVVVHYQSPSPCVGQPRNIAHIFPKYRPCITQALKKEI